LFLGARSKISPEERPMPSSFDEEQTGRSLQGVIHSSSSADDDILNGHFVSFYHVVPGYPCICWQFGPKSTPEATSTTRTCYADLEVVRFDDSLYNGTMNLTIYESDYDQNCVFNETGSYVIAAAEVDFYETNVNIFGYGIDEDGYPDFNVHRNAFDGQGAATTDSTFVNEASGFESCEFYFVSDGPDFEGTLLIDLATSRRGTGQFDCSVYEPYPTLAVQCRTAYGYAEVATLDYDLSHLCVDASHDFIAFGQAGMPSHSPYKLQVGFIQGAHCAFEDTCGAYLSPSASPSVSKAPALSTPPSTKPTASLAPSTTSPSSAPSSIDSYGECVSNLQCPLLSEKFCDSITNACADHFLLTTCCDDADKPLCFNATLTPKPTCCQEPCNTFVACRHTDYCTNRPDRASCNQVIGDCLWRELLAPES